MHIAEQPTSVSAAVALNSASAPSRVVATPMHAIVHRKYGPPEVLAYEEIARPNPGDEEVRVRVHAASANVGDHHVVTGTPYLIRLSPFGGLPGPKHRVPGALLAGRVDAVGAKVTSLRVGDEVFGQAANGAFAEYVVLPATRLAPKPGNVSFEEAAAIPWGVTALQGLRAGGMKAGDRVLIVGASGGVGTWAVQVAKALGAKVTAVCSTRNVELVRSLGADEVIDYSQEDFTQGGSRFEVVLDLVGNRPLSQCRSVLTAGGVYVACAAGEGNWLGPVFRILGGLIASIFMSRKFKAFVMTPLHQDLVALKELVESGKAKPVIERTFALSEVAAALKHVGEGHSRGQTVIRVPA